MQVAKSYHNKGSIFASLFSLLLLPSCGLFSSTPKVEDPVPVIYPDLTGVYHRNNYYAQGELTIQKLDNERFRFSMNTYMSGHSGHLDSIGIWKGDTAYFMFVDSSFAEGIAYPCELKFWIKDDSVYVSEPYHRCSYFHGVRASFAGVYHSNPPAKPTLFGLGILNSNDLELNFKTLVGDSYYDEFIECAVARSPLFLKEGEEPDGYELWIPGDSEQRAAMIMSEGNSIWALIILRNDDLEQEIHVFTNDNDHFPTQMLEWADSHELPYVTH